MPKMDIDKLAEGKTLLGWKGEGIWELTGPNTHPEDMALEPAAYLKGIDPEQGSYGIRSALELWLKLEEKGFMDAGFGEISEDPRLLFQQELGKYSSVKSVA